MNEGTIHILPPPPRSEWTLDRSAVVMDRVGALQRKREGRAERRDGFGPRVRARVLQQRSCVLCRIIAHECFMLLEFSI